ncbi:hypothetical protein PV336_16240 [Streptomyces sp. MI02-2A]|uniref:hypothetical protein n=1 Tax=Streptomyces sp. MI02-2A TaxID=3028688 RepID=UPI0029BABD0B|nr:hypothetical protein [Streptomyces sp. MI02-2A]MDX3260771.1 hypothetical protein [Streptomyces sp. MI02-2A]
MTEKTPKLSPAQERSLLSGLANTKTRRLEGRPVTNRSLVRLGYAYHAPTLMEYRLTDAGVTRATELRDAQRAEQFKHDAAAVEEFRPEGTEPKYARDLKPGMRVHDGAFGFREVQDVQTHEDGPYPATHWTRILLSPAPCDNGEPASSDRTSQPIFIYFVETTPEIEPKGMYARHTGGAGRGWSRRVCEDNSASVKAVMASARQRGDAVVLEDNGVIRVDNAGVIDPSHEHAGERCPVWFVPFRKTPLDRLNHKMTAAGVLESIRSPKVPNDSGDVEGAQEEGFYVTVRDHNRAGFLLGPYTSKEDAESNVSRARRYAEDQLLEACFYEYGTARAVAKPGRSLPQGKLNDRIGLWDPQEADQTSGGVQNGIAGGEGSDFPLTSNQNSGVHA